jgi:hypothetical protein
MIRENFKILLSNFNVYIKDKLLQIKHYKSYKLVPIKSFHDDIYLVSYPRSGSMWLTFIVANILLKINKVDRKVNWFNVHHIVPDIENGRDLSNPSNLYGFRVIKSHSLYNPFYKSVIYLVRNPEDVMVSYYKFLLKLDKSYNDGISNFIRSKEFGIKKWVDHVNGWLDSYNNAALGIVILKYEDLTNDLPAQINKLCSYFGFSLPEKDVEYIVSQCSFSNMKKMNLELTQDGRPLPSGFDHLRNIDKKLSDIQISKEDKDYIKKVSINIMNKFNYS